MPKPTTPEAETIALALRLLRAAFPDSQVAVEILDPSPRAVAVIDALGGRTISDGPRLRMVRAELAGARLTTYVHAAAPVATLQECMMSDAYACDCGAEHRTDERCTAGAAQ